MFELIAAPTPSSSAVEQVAYLENVGRVASFRLTPDSAVPETRNVAVLLVAATDLEIEVGQGAGEPSQISLQAGQVHLFAQGLTGLANTGEAEARFTLIDLPQSN